MQFSDAVWWRHNKSKMADGCHIENRFFRLYLGAIFDGSTRNLEGRWRITCRYRSRDQNCNFAIYMMADSRDVENSIISILQPTIIRFLSNLLGKLPWWTFNKKSTLFKHKMADGRHIEYRFFGYISAPYWPNDAKFGTEMKDHMPI